MTASYALCGSGCWSSGCFPNKVEFTPHQSIGCCDEGWVIAPAEVKVQELEATRKAIAEELLKQHTV
jgi:hypothetical protein